MDKKFMNKMDNMEMDKVSGGKIFPRPRPGCHDSNTNSMAANVDETQMKLPIGGGHKITMAANIMGATENANSMAAKGK
ncbi:hypothetical protein FZ041_13310 [Selenomonas caprae]|uniref:Bacteriocin n=1 Tax=Selenomonas caprae TaxID=2606905 RepID=A0A5D6WH75_9FIRM|nr:hypothetical protein [Selenomonas caprae]TYZ26822.1 hypothetical protein FZ041_13310 [Selenomonas caprae]